MSKIEKEEKVEEIKNEEVVDEVEEIDLQIEKLKNDIDTLTSENNELKEKNIRITADMVNSLRRKDEECQRMLKYSSENLILELLVIVDNFERAIKMDNEETNFMQGMQMIYNSLLETLKKYEVKEIEALNMEFDPNMHQAVMSEEKEGITPNIVIEVMQKGYIYKDKVIRPAMVKVSK